MTLAATNMAWRQHLARPNSKLLFVALTRMARPDGLCEIHVSDIINHTSLMGYRLRDALRDLEGLNWIDIIDRPDPGRFVIRISLAGPTPQEVAA